MTRFAPLWGLYTLCMILGMMLLTQGSGNGYSFQRDLCSLPQAMNVINFGYAVLAAQLLFGDLYNSRMCNALHALPIRRECWFGTHVAAGFAFSLVPTLIGALTAAGLDAISNSMVTASWQLPWLNLALMNLQYLFYFGLAVFCVMCVGNRFAMTLVYGIVNFFAVIVYWFYYTIYEPLLYGVFITEEPFVLFCPVWQMIDNYEVIHVARAEVEHATYSEWFVESVTLGEGVTEVGTNAFADIRSLDALHIGDSVTLLGAYAFVSDSHLKVTFGENSRLSRMEDGALNRPLVDTTLPHGITYIGEQGLYGDEVSYAGTMAEWEAIEKHEKWCSDSITVHCTDGDVNFDPKG